jgi:CHAT domain/SIR2-like domain
MAEISYAEIDIALSSYGGNHYRAELNYWPLEDDARQPAVTGEVQLNPSDFTQKSPEDYSKLLTECLFADQTLREAFLLAQEATYGRSQNPTGMRVRLAFDRGTDRLQSLRWETLSDPPGVGTQGTLSTNDLVPFSRFLRSWIHRPVRLRPKCELRTLVLIASPANVEDELQDGTPKRATVDVNGEWERAKTSLQGLPTPQLLARHQAAAHPPTRKNLLDELATGYDILYIVCHGGLDDERPYLLLENDSEQADNTEGAVLVDAVRGLLQPPRLVVLTACESAGTGLSTDNKGHLALGPDLIRAGVPAVLAMNGKVSMKTAAEFHTRFFAELLKHGYVDRAVCTARRTVKSLSRSDWWMPVLYMRLKAGRIWSVPHVVQRADEPWEELALSLKNNRCTPIVGLGLQESLWGSPREVALRWAEERGFPLAPYRGEDLPAVAQYLARRRSGAADRTLVASKWIETVEDITKRRWPGLGGGHAGLDDEEEEPAARLSRLASEVGAKLRQDPDDPYCLLARLPVEVYLTVNPDPLLADALKAARREPLVEYARWTDALASMPRAYDENDKKIAISKQRPLVFHLFGILDVPDSLVVTEDDFFDYLMCVVEDKNGRAIPARVRSAWSTSALLFLGFDLDDWPFRVLYRAILHEPGHQLRFRQGTLSAAVQLNPEEDRNLRPETALHYLEQVFGSERISVSWTQPQDFLRQVSERLQRKSGGSA